MEPCMVPLTLLDGLGLMAVTVTGPTTHGSPLANVPVGRSLEKDQVMPWWETALAASERVAVTPVNKRTTARERRDRSKNFISELKG